MRGTFKEVMNQALNQTLSRTIITSGTVFLATMSLFIFGGGEINDFAFTFLIGIITGTYSSIYIASAMVLWWHKGSVRRSGIAGGGPKRGPARDEQAGMNGPGLADYFFRWPRTAEKVAQIFNCCTAELQSAVAQ